MIKKIILYALPVLTILFYSCKEDFSPYGDYHENYAFTCILKSDMNSQVAFLSHSYRPSSVDPYENEDDPLITNADVRVWYNDSVFVFRDTSVVRTDSSRYQTPLHFYYNDQFRVTNKKSIELEVLLPNGKRLKSSSVTPGEIFFDDRSEVIIPPVGKSTIQFIWKPLDESTLFANRMTIRYKQNVNGSVVEKTKDVPVRYVVSNGEDVPYFPKPNNSATVVYDLAAVTKALEEISAGDPDKQNYSIYPKVGFDLIAFDHPASQYVSSISGSVDDLTVSVSASDYTNIEGGYGIFGSYIRKDYERLKFLESYIKSFGYNFINEN